MTRSNHKCDVKNQKRRGCPTTGCSREVGCDLPRSRSEADWQCGKCQAGWLETVNLRRLLSNASSLQEALLLSTQFTHGTRTVKIVGDILTPSYQLQSPVCSTHVLLCVLNFYSPPAPSGSLISQKDFNPLNKKRRLLYLKTQFVPRSKHFSSRL